ncbi:MAG: ROK family protein [Burkholderiaceae bacterium]
MAGRPCSSIARRSWGPVSSPTVSLACGANSLWGGIGHYPTRATRLVCSCGQSDCLNCSASGWSILHRLGAIDHPVYQPDEIAQYSRLTRALATGDMDSGSPSPRHARLLREAGLALAKALRYVELTLNPDMLVLAGPLAANEAYYRGVLKGLQSSGAASADVTLKLARSGTAPSHAAAQVALLDTVFDPSLDLSRLGRSAATDHRRESA